MKTSFSEEYRHLIDDYLCINNRIKDHGFHAISRNELCNILHSLVPFESPDMYSLLGDKAVILEHFEFDASRSNRKGMEGKRKEAQLEQKIAETKPDGSVHIEHPEYDISLDNWISNFEHVFRKHYDRIDQYKENISRKLGSNAPSKFIVGFFVENQLPPYIVLDGKTRDIPYVWTQQFRTRFKESPKLDFVLSGGYLSGLPQLIYIDKDGLESIDHIDLRSDRVKLSHINKNDVVFHGGFSLSEDDIDN